MAHRVWDGMTVCCLASGPSLTREDVELVRRWRQAANDRRVIVTNNTYQLAPWADVLYAMDRRWWEVMQPEFAGERITVVHGLPGVRRSDSPRGDNSGAGAILLAAHRGASRILLLGYDCQYGPNGERHWHGNHRHGLGNAASLPKFAGQFLKASRMTNGAEVINCSRTTALEVWPRRPLEEVLG